MNFILNIDTSLETAAVSIAKDGVIVSFQINEIQKEHAVFVHMAIKELLLKESINAKDLAAVAVTIGPGSYTGLRVGLSAAKGLCYALKIPLITIGTLELMAKDANIHNTLKIDAYCPLIDARRMEVFTAMYDQNLSVIEAPNAQILTDLSFFDNFNKKNILFFGSGMQKWKNICTSPNAYFFDQRNLCNAMNIISFDKFSALDFSNLRNSAPLYVKAFYNP
jgi:tRNA threonylcarbamoyladenosine biosynthesis protein TsaB